MTKEIGTDGGAIYPLGQNETQDELVQELIDEVHDGNNNRTVGDMTDSIAEAVLQEMEVSNN